MLPSWHPSCLVSQSDDQGFNASPWGHFEPVLRSGFARPFCVFALGPDAGSLEARLHGLSEPYLLVDTRISSSVLTASEPTVVSGWEVVPKDHYNALLFVDTSPRMVPLFRPPCNP